MGAQTAMAAVSIVDSEFRSPVGPLSLDCLGIVPRSHAGTVERSTTHRMVFNIALKIHLPVFFELATSFSSATWLTLRKVFASLHRTCNGLPVSPARKSKEIHEIVTLALHGNWIIS